MLFIKQIVCAIYLVIIGFVQSNNNEIITDTQNRQCEPIVIEECLNIGYNYTGTSNFLGHFDQSEAAYAISTFRPLVSFGCSSRLQLLLCSFYIPMCTEEIPNLIGPCRSLCEGVERRCAPLLNGFGYPWPALLNCSVFPPENNDLHMCMEGPDETVPLITHPNVEDFSIGKSQCIHFAQPQLYVHINSTNRCLPICGSNIRFSTEDKLFAAVWIVIWAVPVFCLSAFVAVSYVLDTSLFEYPDKAAVNMCIAFIFIASGYLIRIGLGSSAVTCSQDPDAGVSVIISEGGLSVTCIVVFVLLYYFSISAGVWWIMLSWMWLLQAWKRFTRKQLEKFSSVYLTLGWGIPACVTTTVIMLKKIQSDELTGVCFAGGYNPDSVFRWVLIPQLTFVVLGATMVVLTFASYWRARSVFITHGLSHTQFEVAAAKVGVMSILYLIPEATLIGTTIYEIFGWEQWRREPGIYPSVEVFMLKIFMSLAPGLLISLFLINHDVFNTWKAFYKRHFNNDGKNKGNVSIVLPKDFDIAQLLTMTPTKPDNNKVEETYL